MKRFGYIALIFVLTALTGCVKTELAPSPKDRISFAVASYAPSARNSSLLAADGGISSFKSKAWLYADGYMDAAQSFFGATGETISWNASTSEWLPSHPYYWPKSSESYINFVSWYDRNGTPNSVSETAITWTFDGSSRSLATNDNLMFADEAWRYNQNTTNAAQYTGDDVLVGVPTLFHHALAQVRFRAKITPVSDGGTTWSASITDFCVSGVYKTGTLSLVNADPGSNQTRAWWSMSNEATPAATTPYWSTEGCTADTLSRNGQTISLTVNDTPVSIMDTRSIIPQSTQGMVLTCNCNIRTTYADRTYMVETVPVRINISDFSGDIGSWDMNHRITYTITVNPVTGKILFDPALNEGWTNDTNNLMYIE
ncbi:MAG: hypothetical protein IJV01_02775 [Bacteroidales bacterium]|nr:hypothetical protein [Bacteroidales bacterium]